MSKCMEKIVNSLFYFDEAMNNMSLERIAQKMGLHIGTLKRWKSERKVPPHYKADLERLLEKKPTHQSTRDKDQYFTKPEVAEDCWGAFLKVAQQNLKVNLLEYHFIEPSTGQGCFYDLLPPQKRIGIDIDPAIEGIIKSDYLLWKPATPKPYIVIGNPPFGLRGHLALQFINHSYPFADIVAFILPQLFESDGKGAPSKRVHGYTLAHSQKIDGNSFVLPNGKEMTIHTLFQVWSKVNTHLIPQNPKKSCDNFIRVYSLSDGGTPSSTRNKNMLDKCDVYLPSTCFDNMKAFSSFEELPHRRGYGVVIYRDKQIIKDLLMSHDWNKTAFYSTNSAVNLRASLIQQVLIQAGFCDDFS